LNFADVSNGIPIKLAKFNSAIKTCKTTVKSLSGRSTTRSTRDSVRKAQEIAREQSVYSARFIEERWHVDA
jgi:divalent metal cation (Fe/Co/Zn/Cd) transporter